MLDYLKQVDRELFLLINGCHADGLDPVMVFISAKLSWIPLYAYLFYLIVKNYKRNAIYIILAIIVMITLSDQGSVLLFKNIFQRLRPCHEPSLQHLVHLVNNKCGGAFGFISSHAANTMALSVFIFMLLNGKLGKPFLLIFLFPLVVGYSRVYLGIHYPADVICGMIFGGLIGYLTTWIYFKIMSAKIIKT